MPDTISDDLVRLIRERNAICAMLSNTITGKVWQKHLADKAEREKKAEGQEGQQGEKQRPKTSAEIRKKAASWSASSCRSNRSGMEPSAD